MCVTSAFALHPDAIGDMFSKVMKIQLMIFVTMALLHTRKQVEAFVWAIVLSIGFYGAKGGLFTLRTGGLYQVQGPGGSFIAGNNELGLALLTVLPLMYYGYMVSERRLTRLGFGSLAVLTAASALGTQSRGAMLGVAATAIFLWLKNPKKLRNGIVIAVTGLVLVAFMPATWTERMSSIERYQQDDSAMGRINAWAMSWNLAIDRPIGGGFEVITPDLFQKYAPDPRDLHAAHSIYFQVLGEHGFPGLILFVLLWVAGWRTASRIVSDARKFEDLAWAARLAAMVQVSFVGYLVGGAFLSLAYFDLPYDLLVILVVLRRITKRRLGTVEATAGAVNQARAYSVPSTASARRLQENARP
jgi:probable O-glycosylation ligase (exosortase A-associated)